MENIEHKKKLYEGKKITPKMALQNAFKNMDCTYNIKILKFEILQKVLNKKMRKNMFTCSKFYYFHKKIGRK